MGYGLAIYLVVILPKLVASLQDHSFHTVAQLQVSTYTGTISELQNSLVAV